MGKLSIRNLERKKLPRGHFQYVVLLRRDARNASVATSNARAVQTLRDTLRGTCVGRHELVHLMTHRQKRVYTHLYLENAMDLAMLKLAHHEVMFKIYRVRVPLGS